MARPVKWYHKYNFLVEIDGVISAGFTTCSELRALTEDVTYREGGRFNPHNAPGLVTFNDITLTRGVSENEDLHNWFLATFDATKEAGEATPDLFRTFDIVQLDRAKEVVARYTVHDAYCKEYSSGDWDNNASEVRMEEVVIKIDHFTKVL